MKDRIEGGGRDRSKVMKQAEEEGRWDLGEAPTVDIEQRDLPPSLRRPLINSFDGGGGTKGQGSRQQQGGVWHGHRKARENPTEHGGQRIRAWSDT